MHGLAVYMKEGLPFAPDLSLENSADSYVCGQLYFSQCLTSFPSIDYLLGLYGQFLILFHLTQMRFSRPTHPNCFSLETLKCIIKNGVPILVKLIDLVYSVIIVLSQITLLRQLTFLLESQTVIRDSRSSALLYLFISSGASNCSKLLSRHWKILIMLLPQFPLPLE